LVPCSSPGALAKGAERRHHRALLVATIAFGLFFVIYWIVAH